MFEKFGEFDSAEELNRAAAAQFKEGDTEAILTIAKENGIDEEDARDYIDGCTPEFVTPLMAYGIMEDWMQYIKIRCSEDPAMAIAVRRKKKSLKGCMAALVSWSFKNARPVDKDILKAAGISYRVTLGIPDMGQAKKIITEYYLGGAK